MEPANTAVTSAIFLWVRTNIVSDAERIRPGNRSKVNVRIA